MTEPKDIRIIIACEESQAITKSFGGWDSKHSVVICKNALVVYHSIIFEKTFTKC